jgi:phosphoglycolate phosphatase-like HAD superfamily hydrolase
VTASGQALLILFDVDGTLLAGATEAHRDALHAALREVHGADARAVRGSISPAGRTDGEIARAILLDVGVSAERIDDHAEDVRDVCCREYARLCPPDLSHTVLPGVRELLAWLSAHDDVRLSLVTGNYEPVARIKLARAGIGGHFPVGQGAFGSDSEDRAALPRLARRRAGSGGLSHPRARTIVTGDTPRDIACARADDVRCFAVASGPFDASALQEADGVASDAAGLRELLADEIGG